MPLVIRTIRGDEDSGLSTPITVVVCIASSVAALTLGILTWRFIVWRKNKGTTPTSVPSRSSLSPTTVVHLSQKPEPTYLVDPEKGRDYENQIPSPKPLPLPVLMKASPPSNKKSTPALNLDVNCDAEATQPSPLRSASFNPNTKTQSFSSRISSRMSMGAKKLPRLMTVAVLYVPSLSDELPIKLGETIRMIEVYEDEWCLVQRVGRTDERGVVPRFCLVERQEIIPRTGKRLSSGLFQTSTFRK
ncbi:hypothetical protein BDM02DRAFT_3108515 [Thelephora ganbajun]|uniref:Uncharacterized protein n=1 Tax=Thelephora ganbajun TaxID=370292 RepID=A0ACB6ZTW2_THEGA|nr:hypothetical protein BDM02DRAFT_3108515 [Thelephora ganbajun]